MKEVTERWVRKSDGDFRSMKLLFSTNEEPNYDAVCYHAQQSIEKLLKAVLIESNAKFRRTHDLQELLVSVLDIHPELANLESNLSRLTELGMEFRYPDEFASKFDAERSIEIASEARNLIRQFLGPADDALFA
jgi:HEPN domain-containing protein